MPNEANMTSQPTSLVQQIHALLEQVASIQIASLNDSLAAESSYTPYLWQDQKIYIFVSELVAHTRNLRQRPKADLMMIEDESAAKNIFARQRLTFDCDAQFIGRDDPDWTTLLEAFEARHGNTVALLKTLSDFHLICLKPNRGSYVKGFGQAFTFESVNFEQAQQQIS